MPIVSDQFFYSALATVGGCTVLLVLYDLLRNALHVMQTLKDENTALKDQLHVLRLKSE